MLFIIVESELFKRKFKSEFYYTTTERATPYNAVTKEKKLTRSQYTHTAHVAAESHPHTSIALVNTNFV